MENKKLEIGTPQNLMSREEILIDIQKKNDIRSHNVIDKFEWNKETENLLIHTHLDGMLYFINHTLYGKKGSCQKEELQQLINSYLDWLTVRINLDIHVVPIDNLYNVEVLTREYLIYHKENLFQYEDYSRFTEQEALETRCSIIQKATIFDVFVALRSLGVYIWHNTMNLKYYRNPAIILKGNNEFSRDIQNLNESQIIELNRSLTANYDIYMSLNIDFQRKFNIKK